MAFKSQKARKQYAKEYGPRWNRANRKRRREINKGVRLRLRSWFEELKRSKRCTLCPEHDPACLDFHHRSETAKLKEVSVMVCRGYSRNKILEEIEKCEVLCANCHRKIHLGNKYNSHLCPVWGHQN